jgi:PAP_fibrillin
LVYYPQVSKASLFLLILLLIYSSSLIGKLNVLDEKWIQVIFEPPELKIGSLGFQYGGESEVKLEITYVDEKIRLGKGSRGSLFVFLRQK